MISRGGIYVSYSNNINNDRYSIKCFRAEVI